MCLIFVLGASLYRGRTKWLQLVKAMSGSSSSRKRKVEPEPEQPTIVKPYDEGDVVSMDNGTSLDNVKGAASSYDAEEPVTSAEEEAKLLSAFKSVDKDGSGHISTQELSRAVKATGLRKTKAELKAIFTAADTNGDGQLDWDEASPPLPT